MYQLQQAKIVKQPGFVKFKNVYVGEVLIGHYTAQINKLAIDLNDIPPYANVVFIWDVVIDPYNKRFFANSEREAVSEALEKFRLFIASVLK